MFIWIGIINVTISCIWIPGRLQISETYIHVNAIADKVQKGLYLITDASLNWFFIYIVKKCLVDAGLTRYNELVKFNMLIIWSSSPSYSLHALFCIGMMFLQNTFVYTIFHPLTYIVKLEIEMTMSNLIVAVATATKVHHEDILSETGPSVIFGPKSSKTSARSLQVTIGVETCTNSDADDVDSKIGELVNGDGVSSIRMSPLTRLTNVHKKANGRVSIRTNDPTGVVNEFQIHSVDLERLENGQWSKLDTLSLTSSSLPTKKGKQRHSARN
ncbi:hypothetical protein D9758_002455 [Tetrapyrgos nigripes]|uniref:Uncharacterized protein n=1 Tax=Tetrapyrgos nigripes TaxID=182062 RepID=A0A8H5LSM6_9AGAR|nr:hypothetical protein D9758_002455 [Tetrapyrgos nigripes]